MRKIILTSIFTITFAVFGCGNSSKIVRVELIDRNDAIWMKKNSLLLIVELDESGRLGLNKIETGTISDVSILTEKLEVIFSDREKKGIGERAVVIDPQSRVNNEDLEKLIESLAGVKAAPIRVIKNNL